MQVFHELFPFIIHTFSSIIPRNYSSRTWGKIWKIHWPLTIAGLKSLVELILNTFNYFGDVRHACQDYLKIVKILLICKCIRYQLNPDLLHLEFGAYFIPYPPNTITKDGFIVIHETKKKKKWWKRKSWMLDSSRNIEYRSNR